MTRDDWAKVVIGVLVALAGGALGRYLIPTTRRADEAATRKAMAEANKTMSEQVHVEVGVVRSALEAVNTTLASQRAEFAAREAERTEQIRELREEVKALRHTFRNYVRWSQPAISAWRQDHPDYPDPPEIDD